MADEVGVAGQDQGDRRQQDVDQQRDDRRPGLGRRGREGLVVLRLVRDRRRDALRRGSPGEVLAQGADSFGASAAPQ
jgi:hypothetical protein